MPPYTYHFQDLDKTQVTQVGGKAANLAKLCRIDGVQVPEGFCISTEAFEKTINGIPSVLKRLDELSGIGKDEQSRIKRISHEIRETIQGAFVPQDVRYEIQQNLLELGDMGAYAIRSSATAEDLATTSFAGQHDTFLNVIGYEAILEHVSKCWASLFTERAVRYRLQHGFDHRNVQLAVVVQRMIFPQVSGIMFTADPVTANRKVLSIDASFGLGEALVSGIVNADNYKVREAKIIEKKINEKKLAVGAVEGGGTTRHTLAPELHVTQALSDEQILVLAEIARRIEAHFGCPQDIEWCLANNVFFIVQTRPITTLYPMPQSNDRENRVYLSVGHQQMMTDAMKPLGLSIWQLIAGRPMFEAGSRLFVDVTQMLTTASGRELLLVNMGQFDPLIRDALCTIIERDFIKTLPHEGTPSPGQKYSLETDHAVGPDSTVVTELINDGRKSLEALERDIRTRSGEALFEFIQNDIAELTRRISDPKSMKIIMTAIYASAWINNKMSEWLHEKNAADILSQSVPNNVTSEMGLELLDVADAVRPYPDVISYLKQAPNDDFPQGLLNFEGGDRASDAIENFLQKYGMRCAGEIDITKPRWAEKPSTLVPLILNYIKSTTPDESRRKFEAGQRAASEKELDLLNRLRRLPDGEKKAIEAKQQIDIIRHLSGYREYPKYSIVSRLYIYKKALLKEAQQLVEKGILPVEDDIAYLTFSELREVVQTNKLDSNLISHRKERHKSHELLAPPRVITSEGEVITGHYKKENLPADAIVGLAVSSGLIEGRARVILSLDEADLEEGDILITTFTDPSWTPVFLSVKGLVTEVGGLMTHGAVIAREYGLPAIVGVEHATRRIKDGQRIRLNGTDGYVEIL